MSLLQVPMPSTERYTVPRCELLPYLFGDRGSVDRHAKFEHADRCMVQDLLEEAGGQTPSLA